MIFLPDFNQAKENRILDKKKVPIVKAKIPVKMTSEEIRKCVVPSQQLFWGWQKDERATRDSLKSTAETKEPKTPKS